MVGVPVFGRLCKFGVLAMVSGMGDSDIDEPVQWPVLVA